MHQGSLGNAPRRERSSQLNPGEEKSTVFTQRAFSDGNTDQLNPRHIKANMKIHLVLFTGQEKKSLSLKLIILEKTVIALCKLITP